MDRIAQSFRCFAPLASLRRLLARWRAGMREAEALRTVLDKQDDRLLGDAGLDREAAHRHLGETPLFPGRAWDRWQL